MEKVTPDPLSEAQLVAFEGRYFNAELETFYTLRVEEGKLMAHHRRLEPFGLTHVEGDEFSGGMWFMGSVRFHRDPDGSVSGFLAGNGRTRDVWFEKVD